MDPADRAPVGLVAPVGRALAGGRGERLDLRRRGVDARRERELLVEQADLLEVVREDERRLLHERAAHHRRVHVRIAVAVAADPGADGEERRKARRIVELVALLQRLLELRVQPRQLVEEGEAEVREAVRDLVRDFEPRVAQHGGEPQAKDFRMQTIITFRRLVFAE